MLYRKLIYKKRAFITLFIVEDWKKSMKKNISIILFFIMVTIATYLTSYFAEAAKVTGFIDNQKELYNEDYDLLIQKTIIAYYRDKTDAYVLKSPIYSLINNEENSAFDFSIKAYVSIKEDVSHHGVVFLLKNVQLNDSLAELNKHNQPVIDVKIYYDPSFIYNEKEFSFSTETFVPVSDTNISLFFIDYENLLNEDDNYSKITKLEFSYRTNDIAKIFYTVDINSHPDFSKKMSTDKIIFDYKASNNLIYHNDNLLTHYKSFNSYYFKYLFIEAIIVIVLAYFSFFHKVLINKYRTKKFEQRQLYEDLMKEKEKEDNL